MQIAYNISVNQTTDTTLFFINYKYNINLFQESKKVTVLTEQINVTVTNIQKLYKKLKKRY